MAEGHPPTGAVDPGERAKIEGVLVDWDPAVVVGPIARLSGLTNRIFKVETRNVTVAVRLPGLGIFQLGRSEPMPGAGERGRAHVLCKEDRPNFVQWLINYGSTIDTHVAGSSNRDPGFKVCI